MTADPKGLIRESYRIEGITPAECRSIFLDWALSVPPDADHARLIDGLLATYAADHPTHPMTETLRAGLVPPGAPRRRGGERPDRLTPASPRDRARRSFPGPRGSSAGQPVARLGMLGIAWHLSVN